MNSVQTLKATDVSTPQQSSVQSSTATDETPALMQARGDIMNDINDLMVKMVALYKKLRNLLQEYNQKQQSLGWDIQKASVDRQKEAALTEFASGVVSGGASILGGCMAIRGANIGTDQAMAKAKGISSVIEGGGKLSSSVVNLRTQQDKIEGDLIGKSASSYLKGAETDASKAMEVSG